MLVTKPQHNMNEIDYEEAAKILECSPRNARRIVARSNVKPIRRGYRIVRFKRDHIVALKKTIDQLRSNRLVIKIGGHR